DGFVAFRLPVSEESEKLIETVAGQVTKGRPDADRRDDYIDGGNGSTRVRRQQLERPEVRDLLAQWVLALRIYSRAVRNLEEVDASRKNTHLHNVLAAWAKGLRTCVALIGEIFEQGGAEIGG